MALKLANGERILRSYDYATSRSRGLAGTTGSKTLIVTNKRIIHREKTDGRKSSGLNTSEMPIEAAKYVRTNFKVTRYPILLILGILFALLALASLFIIKDIGPKLGAFFLVGIIAALFILIYALKKTYSFACSIDTNTHITNAFGFSSVSGDSITHGLFAMFRRANRRFYIKVKVNSPVAEQMADELGYVLTAAANGDFDEVESPVTESFNAFKEEESGNFNNFDVAPEIES